MDKDIARPIHKIAKGLAASTLCGRSASASGTRDDYGINCYHCKFLSLGDKAVPGIKRGARVRL